MLNDLELEESVRVVTLNLMLVLYDCGISEIHLGGLMRILGVPNSVAKKHDNDLVVLDETFVKYMMAMNSPKSANQSLH